MTSSIMKYASGEKQNLRGELYSSNHGVPLEILTVPSIGLMLCLSQAATITDEDIDAIIMKGVQSTAELNEKMKDYTDNAMKFTMDGGIAYDYKDEDDQEEDSVDYKQLIGNPFTPSPH